MPRNRKFIYLKTSVNKFFHFRCLIWDFICREITICVIITYTNADKSYARLQGGGGGITWQFSSCHKCVQATLSDVYNVYIYE